MKGREGYEGRKGQFINNTWIRHCSHTSTVGRRGFYYVCPAAGNSPAIIVNRHLLFIIICARVCSIFIVIIIIIAPRTPNQ